MWLYETQFSSASAFTRVLWMRLLVLFAITLAATSGCVTVRANQRGNLAKRSVTNDVDMGEGRFDAHANGAREGAQGGTNHPAAAAAATERSARKVAVTFATTAVHDGRPIHDRSPTRCA